MTNALATIEKTSSDFIEKFSSSLAGYAERDYNNKHFFKSVQLAILESTQLQECFKTPAGQASLFHALRFASATGLSLNPQEGKAALIAYKGKVQYQVMKNGLLDLAMDSGQVKVISSDSVREHDEFKLSKTASGDDYIFTPAIKNRGEIIGFYASVRFKEGVTSVAWMTVEEVEAHRDQYSAMYKNNKNNSPWFKSFEGMGLKTVIKRLFRNLSISPVMDSAIGTDDKFEADTINITPMDVPEEKPGSNADDVKKKLKDKAKESKAPETATGDDNQGSLL